MASLWAYSEIEKIRVNGNQYLKFPLKFGKIAIYLISGTVSHESVDVQACAPWAGPEPEILTHKVPDSFDLFVRECPTSPSDDACINAQGSES